jgi:hypothetical protein
MKLVAIEESITLYTWNCTEVGGIFYCTFLIMKYTQGVHYNKWLQCGLVILERYLFLSLTVETFFGAESGRDKYIIAHYRLLYWLCIPQRSAWI